VDNKVADALSRKLCTLQSLSANMIGFECLIHEYPTCRDFGEIYTSLTRDPPTTVEGFTIVDVSCSGAPVYAFPTLWSFYLGDA